MFILLVYDVDFNYDNGPARLRKIASICENYGNRVQNSVFEIDVDQSKLKELKIKLEKAMDRYHDSIRLYKLKNKSSDTLEILGKINKIETLKDDAYFL